MEESEEAITNLDDILAHIKQDLDILEDNKKKLNISDLRDCLANIEANLYFLFSLLKNNKEKKNGCVGSLYS